MDILKARERARRKGEEEQKTERVERVEEIGEKVPPAKRAKKKRAAEIASKKIKKQSGREEEISFAESEPAKPVQPQEPSSAKVIIPEAAKAPEEIELTEEDICGLYGTQEMPELPETIGALEADHAHLLEKPQPEEVREKKIKATKPESEPKEKLTFKTTSEELKTRTAEESVTVSEIPQAEVVEEAKETGVNPIEFLSFLLGREEYALPLVRINEIIKPRTITEVPRCKPFVMGILSLRGVIIPIFDLAARLGLGKVSSNKHSRVIIVRRSDGELVGLAVDSVQDVVRVLPSDIEPPPPAMAGVETQFLEGVGRAEDSRRIRAGIKDEGKEVELAAKRKGIRRKLVILLNLEKVAVL